jgi:hypothetical protein
VQKWNTADLWQVNSVCALLGFQKHQLKADGELGSDKYVINIKNTQKRKFRQVLPTILVRVERSEERIKGEEINTTMVRFNRNEKGPKRAFKSKVCRILHIVYLTQFQRKNRATVILS